jgi:hypothetical protein
LELDGTGWNLITLRQYEESISQIRQWSRALRPEEMACLDNWKTLQKKIKRCKTVFWYHHLSRRNDLNSARSLQKLFIPDSFKRQAGVKTFDSGIFGKYRKGKHQPTKSTLLEIEKISPRSSAPLHLMLWDVLGNSDFTHNKTLRWLRRLPPEVHPLIFKVARGKPRLLAAGPLFCSLPPLDKFTLLTAFTILAREAIYYQNWAEADFWSMSLFFEFIGFCRYLRHVGIAKDLFEIYESLIFSRTIVCGKLYLELPVRFRRVTGPDGATWPWGPTRRTYVLYDTLGQLRFSRTRPYHPYKGLLGRRPQPAT